MKFYKACADCECLSRCLFRLRSNPAVSLLISSTYLRTTISVSTLLGWHVPQWDISRSPSWHLYWTKLYDTCAIANVGNLTTPGQRAAVRTSVNSFTSFLWSVQSGRVFLGKFSHGEKSVMRWWRRQLTAHIHSVAARRAQCGCYCVAKTTSSSAACDGYWLSE